MYGEKARIGGIHPSKVSETTVYQFYSILPPGSGVTWAAVSLGTVALTYDELDRVRGSLIEAAKTLAASNVDIIVQSGVPVVVSKGYGYDEEIVKEIMNATGLPAVTDIGSTVRALRHLGVKRLAVATPFGNEINKAIHGFLERSGFEVLIMRGFHREGDTRPLAIGTARLPLSQTYEFALETALLAPEADALYVSGAPMPFVENIEPLETELGKPVVGALPAMIWNCLQTLKIKISIGGFGSLLRTLA